MTVTTEQGKAGDPPVSGAQPGGGGSGGGGPEGGKAPAPAQQPFAVFHTQADLEERLSRAGASELKAIFGTTDRAKITEMVTGWKSLETKEAERVRAAQTKEEQLATDLATANAKAAQAEARANDVAHQAAVGAACARAGIKNVEYALFQAGKARNDQGGQDAAYWDTFFAKQLENEPMKQAYGITPPPTEIVPTPVTTTPTGGPTPPVPPVTTQPQVAVDAMNMDRDAFRRHLEGIGAGSVG